jgi:hypothetical protein
MSSFRSDRIPLLLFLAGAIASIALLLLVAYAPDLRGDASSDANAVSRSAIGFAGLKRLMDLSGIPTEIDRGVKNGESRPSLTILTPPMGTGAQDWRDYDEQSAVLIILPKWITAPMPLRPDWVVKVAAYSPGSVSAMLRTVFAYPLVQAPGDFKGVDVSAESENMPPVILGDIQQLQYFPGPSRKVADHGRVLLRLLDDGNRLRPDGATVLVQVRGGDKPIYVLSEPDLMNNQGLADQSKAQLALAIIASLRQGKGPVRMDVTMTGMGRTPNLLKALFEPPFRGATLSAFLVAVLMALHALARFGAPLDGGRVVVRGKKALAGNTAELVRIMRREAGMAPRYLQAMRNLVLARLGLTRARSAGEQDALLARMESVNNSDIRYSELAAEAGAARSSGDLIRIAAQAYAWKGKIAGEHQ